MDKATTKTKDTLTLFVKGILSKIMLDIYENKNYLIGPEISSDEIKKYTGQLIENLTIKEIESIVQFVIDYESKEVSDEKIKILREIIITLMGKKNIIKVYNKLLESKEHTINIGEELINIRQVNGVSLKKYFIMIFYLFKNITDWEYKSLGEKKKKHIKCERTINFYSSNVNFSEFNCLDEILHFCEEYTGIIHDMKFFFITTISIK